MAQLDIEPSPKSYQLENVQKMFFKFQSGLNIQLTNEPGLGKTNSVLLYLIVNFYMNRKAVIILINPLLIKVWESEFIKCCRIYDIPILPFLTIENKESLKSKKKKGEFQNWLLIQGILLINKGTLSIFFNEQQTFLQKEMYEFMIGQLK